MNNSTASAVALLYDPTSPAAVRSLLQEAGTAPNRTMGQNFLINPGALDRIVAVAGITSDDQVLEIGPGLGALTCRLVLAAGRVTAIEKDEALYLLLQRRLPDSKLHLIWNDALDLEWSELALPSKGVKVVANLPYSISKPVLRRFMETWRPHLTSATVTVQREVADRIVAPPGASAYGPMALMAQLYGEAKRIFDLKPGSFYPAPDVTSSVVHIVMRPQAAVALTDEALFWRLVRAAFGQRRKQLGNTLRAAIADREQLQSAFHTTGIDPQRRGETLSLGEFAALANFLAAA
jgi:16S rRNA (adenine1518-N6/adenine1519-N6)-dimethyltransferase